jgi:hypothetical protein
MELQGTECPANCLSLDNLPVHRRPHLTRHAVAGCWLLVGSVRCDLPRVPDADITPVRTASTISIRRVGLPHVTASTASPGGNEIILNDYPVVLSSKVLTLKHWYRDVLWGLKWPWRESDRSPLSTGEVKNVGAIPSLPHTLHRNRDCFTLRKP